VKFQILTAANIKISSEMMRRVVWSNFTDVSEVFTASTVRVITAMRSLMMEAQEPLKLR
jgi:hypothetical protein